MRPTQSSGRRPADDPLIDEIRAIRKALSDRFDNDPELLGEYASKVGEAYRNQRPHEVRTTPRIPHDAS